jgi:hypothetical protein
MRQYNYHFMIRFDTSVEMSEDELKELGREIIMSTESFLKTKKNIKGVNGAINVREDIGQMYKDDFNCDLDGINRT